MRAPASIIAIATVLIIASVVIPAGGLYSMMFMNPEVRIFLLPVIAIQTAFGLFGILIAIGLLRLFEAARKAAILLSTATVIVFAAVLLLLWAAAFGTHNTVFLMPFLACVGSLVILLPLSIWWLVMLRRESVQSYFR